MDINKYKKSNSLFNAFEREHPRVLKKMMVYPAACLEDIRLLLASLIKLRSPPIQILVDGIDGFTKDLESYGSNSLDSGLSATLFLLNEYAETSMTNAAVEKKVIINYQLSPKEEISHNQEDRGNHASSSDGKPRRSSPEETGNLRGSSTSGGQGILASLAVPDIAFLGKLSSFASSIIRVFRDTQDTDTILLLQRKLNITGTTVTDSNSSDKDVRDLNELFVKMMMEDKKAEEEAQKEIDEELK